jgi:hypothetical protein
MFGARSAGADVCTWRPRGAVVDRLAEVLESPEQAEVRVARVGKRPDDVVGLGEGDVAAVPQRGQQCGGASRARRDADDAAATHGLQAGGIGFQRELSQL